MGRPRVIFAALLLVAGTALWLLLQPWSAEEQAVEQPLIVPSGRAVERPPPPAPFTDITAAAGIDFIHTNGAEGKKLLPETLGGGVAMVDYDRDGDPDLLFVNGRAWPAEGSALETSPTLALYANDGDGHFSEVTREAGLDHAFYGMGVACGDVDGDGWTDLFFTAVGENRLFRNHQGRFQEVTRAAGVGGSPTGWSSGSTFLDYDGDQDLDLFVVNYVEWSPELDFEVDFRLAGVGRAYGPPTAFPATQPQLFRNDGEGRFTDVSKGAGIEVYHRASGGPVGKGLGVVPLDFDGDGHLDLFVGNDTVRNFLFHNLGDGRFAEVGELFGVAFDRDGAATGAMGVDVADFRGDGTLGLAVGNFANEMTSLYVSQEGGLQFADESIIAGIGPGSRKALTFGLLFLDYDLDGRLDLLQVNGHLEEAIHQVQSGQHYAQPSQLFWNCGDRCDRTFVEVAPDAVGDLYRPLVGRGVARGDIDGDGDPDLVITQIAGAPLLLRNDQQSGHHWLRIRLVGAGGNPAALGAQVTLTAGGLVQRQMVTPTRGYLSQSEIELTFGLGPTRQIDALVIDWPDGTHQVLDPAALALDRTQTLLHPTLESP